MTTTLRQERAKVPASSLESGGASAPPPRSRLSARMDGHYEEDLFRRCASGTGSRGGCRHDLRDLDPVAERGAGLWHADRRRCGSARPVALSCEQPGVESVIFIE